MASRSLVELQKGSTIEVTYEIEMATIDLSIEVALFSATVRAVQTYR